MAKLPKIRREVIDINDFSGGLKIDVPPEELDREFSQLLENYDITETKSLLRRKGYSLEVTGAPTNIISFERHYQSDGDKYWVLLGTSCYSQQYTATTVPETWVEANEWAATQDNNYTGQALCFSLLKAHKADFGVLGTVEYDVPYANRLYVDFATPVTASLKLDDGSWVDVSGNSYYDFGTVTATTHTLYVKGPPDNDKCFSLLVDADDYSWRTRQKSLGSLSGITSRTYSMSFRNSYASMAGQTLGLRFKIQDGDDWFQVVYYFRTYYDDLYLQFSWNVNEEFDVASYVVGEGPEPANSWIYANFRANKISDTVWELVFANSDDFSDAISHQVGGWSGTPTAYITCYHGYGNIGGEVEAQFDQLRQNWALIDDCGDWTGWTAAGNGTDHIESYPGAGVNELYLPVDRFRYSVTQALDCTGSNLIDPAVTRISYAEMNGTLFIITDKDPLMGFSQGALGTLGGTLPTEGSHMIAFRNRLFVVYEDELKFSGLDAPTDWVSADSGHMYPANQGSTAFCTGLEIWDDKLWYFTQTRSYALTVSGTPGDWASEEISRVVGCVAPKSLIAIPNALMFLAADGIRAYGIIPGLSSEDGSGLLMVSGNIDPELQSVSDKSEACAAVYKGRYWLSVGGNTWVFRFPDVNKKIKGGWTKYPGMDILEFVVTRDDDGYGLYGIKPSDGKIYHMEHGNSDLGAPIVARYKSPPLAGSSPFQVKHGTGITISAKSEEQQNITVTLETDDVYGPAQTVAIDEDSASSPIRVVCPFRGKSVEVSVDTYASVSEPLEMVRYVLPYHGRRLI